MDLLLGLLIAIAFLAIVVAIVMLVMTLAAPDWSQQTVKVGDTTWLCLRNKTDIAGCQVIRETR